MGDASEIKDNVARSSRNKGLRCRDPACRPFLGARSNRALNQPYRPWRTGLRSFRCRNLGVLRGIDLMRESSTKEMDEVT